MLNTVVFDMGNVLVHFCHDRMCRQIGEVCGRSGEEIRRLLIDSGLQWRFERGLIEPAKLHEELESLLGRDVCGRQLEQAASEIFSLNEPIVPVLDQLRDQGYRLVLLSNTSVWHFDYIRSTYDVLDRFDEYVVSFREGAIKPEPPIFEAALKAIHCPPQQAFYTDDIEAYVLAGRSYGLQAEVFRDVPQLIEQLRARDVNVG